VRGVASVRTVHRTLLQRRRLDDDHAEPECPKADERSQPGSFAHSYRIAFGQANTSTGARLTNSGPRWLVHGCFGRKRTPTAAMGAKISISYVQRVASRCEKRRSCPVKSRSCRV
jgi:hypothetical protein